MAMHICTHCKKEFTNNFNLQRHITSIHNTSQLYTCNFCERSFNRKNALIRHEESIHKNVTFDCTVCEKSFTRLDSLTRHKRVHKRNKENEIPIHHNEVIAFFYIIIINKLNKLC